ncbi:hypothetical protein [Paraglaciecola sp. L3A3]|uniref:hypothetical protein n=1 Tax=Paraglaciecola sp. L3A3 TaxID=2686358 RepID=UPI00131DCA8E|nr:hypothetical protein [Paraglaciecola sp. L3A3]
MEKTPLFTTLFLTLILAISGCAQINDMTGSDSDSQTSTTNQYTEAEKKAKAIEEDKVEAEAEAQNVSTSIPSDSIFAKVSVGMSDDTVIDTIGTPDRRTSYSTGKNWIPFSGRWLNDKRRQSWFYEKEGVIVMTQNTYTKMYKVLRIDYNANQTLP